MRAFRLIALAPLLLSACLSESTGNSQPSISNLTLTPGAIRASVGDRREVLCTAFGSNREPLERIPPVTWIVPLASVALLEQVEPDDRARQWVVPTAPGTSVVRCSYQGFTASSVINVPPFTVTASNAPDAMPPGTTRTVSVTVATEGGAAVPLIPPYSVQWTSSNDAVLRVTPGTTPGTATLEARSTGTATVNAIVRSAFVDGAEMGRWSKGVQVLLPN
jgi:hypothetical protein